MLDAMAIVLLIATLVICSKSAKPANTAGIMLVALLGIVGVCFVLGLIFQNYAAAFGTLSFPLGTCAAIAAGINHMLSSKKNGTKPFKLS